MTPAQLDHLRRIDAHLANLLSTAEKRTPGEYFSDDFNDVWAKGGHYNYLVAQIEDEETSSFIASCAGNAEAGWRATRAAIHQGTWLMEMNQMGRLSLQDQGATHQMLLDILAAFPLELIQKP